MAMIIVALTLICAWAVSIASYRINDVAYGEFAWSPIPNILILGLFYLVFFKWGPLWQQRGMLRKRQLEALLKELDSQ